MRIITTHSSTRHHFVPFASSGTESDLANPKYGNKESSLKMIEIDFYHSCTSIPSDSSPPLYSQHHGGGRSNSPNEDEVECRGGDTHRRERWCLLIRITLKHHFPTHIHPSILWSSSVIMGSTTSRRRRRLLLSGTTSEMGRDGCEPIRIPAQCHRTHSWRVFPSALSLFFSPFFFGVARRKV